MARAALVSIADSLAGSAMCLPTSAQWKGTSLNNRAIKSLIFGVAVLLFSLLLAFIGFLFLLSSIASTLSNSPSSGQGITVIIVAAFVVGAAGLVIAYMGFAGTVKNQP